MLRPDLLQDSCVSLKNFLGSVDPEEARSTRE